MLTGEIYALFREFIRERIGILYGEARRTIFENRILSRVSALGLRDPNAYFRFLAFHPNREAEFLELASVLTNNETFFFRETTALKGAVGLLKEDAGRRKLRVLSAGSSSGEELGSVGMLLRESDIDLSGVELQGVDLDVRMLAAAREGVYRAKSFRNMDAERMVRFFSPEADGRRLKSAIHDHVDFRWANLVDANTLKFPHPFDIVFCRNVLIYFDPPTVERVVGTLHRLLRDGGHLVTGVSESLSHIPFLFDPERIGGSVFYRKVPL